jgi:ABC-type multidrug transport system ATPase subunit
VPSIAVRALGVGPAETGLLAAANSLPLLLFGQPRVLLVDEPTSGLDLGLHTTIVRLLRRVSREDGTTVIFTSHTVEDLDDVDKVDKVVILGGAGHLIYAGPPRPDLPQHLGHPTYGALMNHIRRSTRPFDRRTQLHEQQDDDLAA